MKIKIKHRFHGQINNVDIYDAYIFDIVERLLINIEYKFGEVYNEKFIKDLAGTIESMIETYDIFSYEQLSNEFKGAIYNSEKFNDIKFTYLDDDWKIEELNENIANNVYNKK